MSDIGKGKIQVCSVLTADLVALITERAEALTISRGRFTARIIQRWADQGHPPVNELDKLMQNEKARLARQNPPGLAQPRTPQR